MESETTRGLGIVPSPTADNLTQPETTNQADLEVGIDSLPCPGSSVVAEADREDAGQRDR